MTTRRAGETAAPTATQVVVARVKQLRRRRGLNTGALSERCAALGASEISDQVVRNIEIGRRTISVEHLCVLAAALEVSPTHLLAADDDTDVAFTPALQVPGREWTAWARGAGPLGQGMEAGAYWGYALEHDASLDAEAAVALARSQASAAVARVMGQVQADRAHDQQAGRETNRALLQAVSDAAANEDPLALQAALAAVREALAADAR